MKSDGKIPVSMHLHMCVVKPLEYSYKSKLVKSYLIYSESV